MTYSYFKKLMMGTLVLVALSMSGCAKNNSSGVRIAGRGAGAVPTTPAQQQGVPNSCPNSQMEVGKIFDPYSSPQFENQVKGFVSATMDPLEFGSISGNIYDSTGIDFKGSFQFDNQGNLVPDSSTLWIKIVDSYVKQPPNGEMVQPFIVEFFGANSGTIDRNTRQFKVIFKDNFGEIIFSGRYDNQIAEGEVTYVNNTAVAGYQAASGKLGSFRAYSCALIK